LIGGEAERKEAEPARAPGAGRTAASPPAAEQRILQADGRRYSVRLEPAFWAALEASAERRRLRVNRLVAELAGRLDADGNLASTLRVYCLRELQRLAQARTQTADRTSLLALAETAPAACLVLGHDRRIVAANDAFVAWLGRPRDDLVGSPVLRHFRFRGVLAFEERWRELGRQWLLPEAMRIINIEPGRVLAANATLVPVLTARIRPSCLVWVKTEGRRG
jgi:predicted DNA-binding ribbon-helix-helix protein